MFYHLWAEEHPDDDAPPAPPSPLLLFTPRAGAPPAAVFANALFWGAVGGVGLLTFAVLFFAARRGAPDRALLALGAALCAAGAALCIDVHSHLAPAALPRLSLRRFCAGLALAWAVGYPLAPATAVSALTKALRAERMGTMLAYQAMAGSAGRVAGPLLAGALYDGATGAAAMAAACLAYLACLACVGALWARLP